MKTFSKFGEVEEVFVHLVIAITAARKHPCPDIVYCVNVVFAREGCAHNNKIAKRILNGLLRGEDIEDVLMEKKVRSMIHGHVFTTYEEQPEPPKRKTFEERLEAIPHCERWKYLPTFDLSNEKLKIAYLFDNDKYWVHYNGVDVSPNFLDKEDIPGWLEWRKEAKEALKAAA